MFEASSIFRFPPNSSSNVAQPEVAGGRSASGLVLRWADSGPLIEPTRGVFTPWRSKAKRLFDMAGAAALLLALLPAMAVIATVLFASNGGKVLFKQQRLGWNGKAFWLLKFRTMHLHHEDPSGLNQVEPVDPRVTAIGAFLRRTSLDELPQLWNVLRGEMSLVGPRPHVAGQLAAGVRYEELAPHYSLRMLVRPGITGWAQANGYRGSTKNAAKALARIDHDIAYIQNQNLWLDMRILWMTLLNELRGGSGY
jgi:polysaccharide biosynthesis protein PslA